MDGLRVTVGKEARPGSGVGTAFSMMCQAGSLVLTEAIPALVPNINRIGTGKKALVMGLAGSIPVFLGIVIGTVLDDKIQSNVRPQGQRR